MHIFTSLFCKKNNIKIFAYTTTGIKEHCIFINDHFDTSGKFFDLLLKFNSKEKTPNYDKVDHFLEEEFLQLKNDSKKLEFKIDLIRNTIRLGKKILKKFINKDKAYHEK